ncbi:FtsK/SpoIIIE domain-containing protein [Janibacter hoylei]|uniref:FtsK/SpoIIIE domain-containing protein n=1 Tax=Janibacter hoylei TaxID=364298 RepID=UPI002237AFBB|nr:FtsK/SpoIIIE domain-containing protein [Janibacter hoylei]MCW4600988.1 FtsK/SpoIIIE domain-containing protein [Janibacter hoylei]
MRDRSDSDDVIGCPDAADLPESAPGRALASTGGGPARAFQTGRIAGHAADSEGPLLLRRPGRPWPVVPPQHASGPSDLERLTATLTQLAARLDVPPPHRPWLPPLPDELTDTQLPSGETGAGAPFALMDLPTEQRQVAAEWSPATGHWMVVGAPGSGRTTALAAVVHAAARRWSPDRLQVQVIGDGSATTTTLSGLDHVGSVVDGEDTTVVGRFLERLEADISGRRRLLRASGHDTLDAWWSAHDSAGGPTPPPHLLLAVDGWGRVTRPRGASDLGETAESLETLMRDGTSAGLCVLVAGGRELLSGRVSSLVASRLVLHLGDRGDAALAGLTRTQVSERLVPGRARWQPGGHLVQVARPASPAAPRAAPTTPPWTVCALPDEVLLADLPPGDREMVPVGLGGSGRDPVLWRTDGARRFLVCGPARSGRSTALAMLAGQLRSACQPLVVLGSPALADGLGCPTLGPDDRDELVTLRQQHPDLAVVVDDLERLEGTPVADVVREIGRRLDLDRGLLIGSTTTRTAAGQVRGLVADLARERTGLLLQPLARSDGDALGLRVPALPRLAGRGYLVVDGVAEEIQVARPGPTAS